MNEISDLIFNNCLKRSRYDKEYFAFFYKYCLKIMKSYVDKHFGNNSRYKDVPHDVFTRIVFDYPPKHFVTNHVAYLCRAVKNFIIDFNNSKNNHLELFDNYAYVPETEKDLEFTDESADRAWKKLDGVSQGIIYDNAVNDYNLKEIAEDIAITYENVRAKKSRAAREFKEEFNRLKQEEKNIKKEEELK